MKLTPNEIETVAEACEAAELAPGQIEALALAWLPEARELALPHMTAAKPRLAIARTLLEALNEKGFAFDYTRKLFTRIDWSDAFRATVGPVLKGARDRMEPQQAFLYRRDNLVPEQEFLEIMEQTGPKICCLRANHGGDTYLGTGFLIGPDRILTAMHVFEDLIRKHGEDEVPRRFRAIFDFAEGELPRDEPEDGVGGRRVVRLHPERWLLAKSPSFEFEGRLSEYTDEQITAATAALDYAVVRLAEPVGEQRIPHEGTRGRGWFEIGNLTDANYDPDIRVAVWQHPFGFKRHFDLGQLQRTLPCGSRIIYAASSAKGSSGGPCLSLDAGVIGVHVAEYRPHGEAEANAAVRFDCIRAAVAPFLGNKPLPKRVRPWKVDDPDGAMLPIIGRDVLLDWLMYAIGKRPEELKRSDRIFVAHLARPDDSTGLSFSAEIARSTLAGEAGDRVVVLGRDEILPAEPEDLALLLGTELSIPEAILRSHPRRPAATLPRNAADGDKLDRWASHAMPEWFLRVAGEYGRERWDRAWVVLDDLDRRPMSPPVRNFVAGFMGVDIDEQAVSGVARRIHWLLLGWMPSFLLSEDATVERIDASAVTAGEICATLTAACDERGMAANDLQQRADGLLELARTLAQHTRTPLMAVTQMLVAKEIMDLIKGGGPVQ